MARLESRVLLVNVRENPLAQLKAIGLNMGLFHSFPVVLFSLHMQLPVLHCAKLLWCALTSDQNGGDAYFDGGQTEHATCQSCSRCKFTHWLEWKRLSSVVVSELHCTQCIFGVRLLCCALPEWSTALYVCRSSANAPSLSMSCW